MLSSPAVGPQRHNVDLRYAPQWQPKWSLKRNHARHAQKHAGHNAMDLGLYDLDVEHELNLCMGPNRNSEGAEILDGLIKDDPLAFQRHTGLGCDS